MTETCPLCKEIIPPGTAAVAIVGGLFPVEDPDFFMVDQSILAEGYVHMTCFVKLTGSRAAPGT